MKKEKLDTLVLVTHWENFHADDVTAGALLKYFLVEKLKLFKSVVVERTDRVASTGKELQIIFKKKYNNAYVIVYDVGRDYIPSEGLFDHHQFTTVEDNRASAGMVFDWLISEGTINEGLRKSMERIIRSVDNVTTGVSPALAGEMSWIINHMNEDFNASDEDDHTAYMSAMDMVERIIRSLNRTNDELENTKRLFCEAGITLPDLNSDFYALEFTTFPRGWQEIIYEPQYKNVDLIITYNNVNKNWQAQTVNKDGTNNHSNRRNRRIIVDEEYINDKSNGIVFVLKGGFFMVAQTREDLHKYLDLYCE